MSWYLKWQSGAEPSVGSTTTSASYAMRRRYGVPASRPGIFGDSIVTSNSGPMNSDEASFLPDLSHVPRSFLADEAPAPCVTKRENIDLRIGPRDELNPNSELDGGGTRGVGAMRALHKRTMPPPPSKAHSSRAAGQAPHVTAGPCGTHVVRPARQPAHMPDAEAVCSRAQSGARHGRSDRFGNQETQVESPARDPRAGGVATEVGPHHGASPRPHRRCRSNGLGSHRGLERARR